MTEKKAFCNLQIPFIFWTIDLWKRIQIKKIRTHAHKLDFFFLEVQTWKTRKKIRTSKYQKKSSLPRALHLSSHT